MPTGLIEHPALERILLGRLDHAMVMPSGGAPEDAARLEAVLDVRGRRHVLVALPSDRGTPPDAWLAESLDASPAIVWLKDLEGRYLRINRRYGETFGITE